MRARLGGEGQIRMLQVDEAERAEVEREARELADEAERLADAATAARANGAERRLGSSARQVRGARGRRSTPICSARLARRRARSDEALGAAADAAARFEAPVRARVDAGCAPHRRARRGAARARGRRRSSCGRAAEEAAERATAVEVELARLDAEAAEAQRRRCERGRQDVEPAEGDDRDELAARAERLEARREAARPGQPAREGGVRGREGAARASSPTQREDLERSLDELEKLRDELAETVERRFEETFARRRGELRGRRRDPLPGRRGRLRLVEPEEEGGEPGIEVELRPAGKKITRLSLLSGGEKALGAISFLFALFLAKPCPFYLLDEVEAALDDTNIARFVELLRRYADRAQFVVITHQKRTMEAADVLYGVTMGGDGVSQIVSRRLPREDAVAASALTFRLALLAEVVLRREPLRRLDQPGIDQALAHVLVLGVLEPDRAERPATLRSAASGGRAPGWRRRSAGARPDRSARTSHPRAGEAPAKVFPRTLNAGRSHELDASTSGSSSASSATRSHVITALRLTFAPMARTWAELLGDEAGRRGRRGGAGRLLRRGCATRSARAAAR